MLHHAFYLHLAKLNQQNISRRYATKGKAMCLLLISNLTLIQVSLVWGGMCEIGQRLSIVAFCSLDAIRGIGRTVHVTCFIYTYFSIVREYM